MGKKKSILIIFISFIFVCFLGIGSINIAFADSNLIYLGGMPAGFSLYSKGAYVAGLCDVITENGLTSPSKNADIMVGDIILSIDGVDVNSSSDIEKAINNKDKTIVIVERDGNKIIKDMIPSKDLNGKYRIGVFVKESISGIGTITFIKDGKFASLGHPVLDDNGNIMAINGGEIYPCSISDAIKGERGNPGELRGIFLKTMPTGYIEKNLENGVYGSLSNNNDGIKNLIKVETGVAKVGKAHIYTTVEGVLAKKYEISIVKIDPINRGTKNFVIRIDDKDLLNQTGGIVQGMSGSPIVQEGKLVGAVTHVFINDPTRGFGIDINNMINNL